MALPQTLLKNKYAIFAAIIIGLFFVLWGCTCNKEFFTGFQGQAQKPVEPPKTVTDDEIEGLKKELEDLFETVSKDLCPSFNIVRNEIAKQKEGATEADKQAAALKQMTAESGGKLYDCRSYPDHLQVPADIGAIVTNSAAYLYKKLTGLVDNVKAALSCKPVQAPAEGFATDSVSANPRQPTHGNAPVKSSNTHYSGVVEYYADICSPELMEVRSAEAKKRAAESCDAPDQISNARKKALLDVRIKSLRGIVEDPAWEPVMVKIREAVAYFVETKKKIDAGTLVPSCSDADMAAFTK
jgi:hypothetical protein